MKDALGHGSNAHSAGINALPRKGQPIVQHTGVERISKAGHERDVHQFVVTHADLQKPVILGVEHWPEYKSGIVNAYGSLENVSKLGPANVRHVMASIKYHLPDIETLKGPRLTGARAGAKTYAGKMQRIDIRRVVPHE